MKRRSLLTVTAVTLSGGCLASLGDVSGGSQYIVNREFTEYQPESDGFERAPGPTDKPTVSFESESKQVVVRGALFVGSSQCHRADLKDVSYDATSKTLTVRVGSGDTSNSGNSCTADESADAYRLVVTMKERLPETFRVEQIDDPSAKSTTVERAR
ncbi:hypothetical protein [Haladaptatus sp. DFWS20]|uniref:hypothetical protein n=1 Tax=Haladaptatus sp. DFWS20 TaxID=3403467 RepID=UPI003EBC5B29